MTQDELISAKIEYLKQQCDNKDCGYRISAPKYVAQLRHEPTRTNIYIYESIGWFKRLMLNWCFGLKYRKL